MPATWAKKWVAKDDTKKEEVKAEELVKPKKELKPAKGESKGSKGGKGDKPEKKERKKESAESQAPKAPAPSPLLSEAPPGPSYALTALLRIRSKADADDDKRSSFFGALTSMFTSETTELKARPYKMEERPPPATEEEKVPGARRAARDAKKAERKASEDAGETADIPEAPQTPSSLKIDLEKELPSKADAVAATPTSAAAHEYFYSYLASMQMQQAAAMQMQMNAAMSAGMTTVMLRNIPNRYSREMLVQRLNNGYEKQYDFVYLPIDFNSKCNVGYAFINFLSPPMAQKFMNEFHGQNCKHVLPGFSSHKIVEVTFARVQGREQNLENLKDEKFMTKLSEQPEWQPLVWENGVEVPFDKLLGESTGRKRSGSRKSVEMSPMAMSPTASAGYSFGMPPYVNPWMYTQPSAAPSDEGQISLAALVETVADDVSLMLRGVPKSYSRAQFLEVVDKEFKGAYDFVFLPMDPKAEGYENRGFAFINFREAAKGKAFTEKFNKAKIDEVFPVAGKVEAEGEKEAKECEVQAAKLASLDSLLNRFQERSVEDTKLTPEWYPLLFDADGNNKDFPMKSTSASSSDKKKKKGEKVEAPGRTAPNPKTKAKAKPKAKGKQMGYPGAYPGFYGYPGYPPMGMGYTHQAAQASAMAQAALMCAYASNPQGQAGMMDQLSAAVNSSEPSLRNQVEYYFSVANLCKDTFLRSKMDADGWVDLDVVATFPKVKQYSGQKNAAAAKARLAIVLAESAVVEVENNKVRLKDAEQRKQWGPVPSEFVPSSKKS
jgi:hypothetical protein|mmetsp:Transcript_101276/g.158201  ORF Transcript_101276/g.158201 Transcript_101276/m.158201 type:complete len:778 (+) Transcript_101276:88-2421(+)